MAEFVEVMGIKKRMCKYYEDRSGGCGGCPLDNTNFCALSDESLSERDFKEAETIMLNWNKKHPVIFPTWIEWLKSIGVIPYLAGCVVKRDDDDNFLSGHVNVNEIAIKPIPKDIAEKLGIQPKEN